MSGPVATLLLLLCSCFQTAKNPIYQRLDAHSSSIRTSNHSYSAPTSPNLSGLNWIYRTNQAVLIWGVSFPLDHKEVESDVFSDVIPSLRSPSPRITLSPWHPSRLVVVQRKGSPTASSIRTTPPALYENDTRPFARYIPASITSITLRTVSREHWHRTLDCQPETRRACILV